VDGRRLKKRQRSSYIDGGIFRRHGVPSVVRALIASNFKDATLFDIAQVTMNVLAFRALARSDFPLLQRWLSEPHVDAWWHEALDLAGLERKYGPRIDGSEPTHVFIIERESRPIGWIQWYRWSDYPKHAAQIEAEPNAAGIDLSIGEASELGKGFGSSAIREFIRNVVGAEPGIAAIVADPEERNGRSCRAFEKAGFIAVRTVELETESVRRRIMRLSLLAVHSPRTGC
jgi:RimJ/RimL family protein N-acetyltransferase